MYTKVCNDQWQMISPFYIWNLFEYFRSKSTFDWTVLNLWIILSSQENDTKLIICQKRPENCQKTEKIEVKNQSIS